MTPVGPPPLEVVYCVSWGARSDVFQHLCALGRDVDVVDGPGPKESYLRWPYGEGGSDVHLFFIAGRYTTSDYTLRDMIARDAKRGLDGRLYARWLAALQRVQVVVFVADDQEHLLWRHACALKVLRADLVEAGRDPDNIPVVFHIDHPDEEGCPVAPMREVTKCLTWPRCAYVEAFPRENRRGTSEALDRAIDLYEAMEDRQLPGPPSPSAR